MAEPNLPNFQTTGPNCLTFCYSNLFFKNRIFFKKFEILFFKIRSFSNYIMCAKKFIKIWY